MDYIDFNPIILESVIEPTIKIFDIVIPAEKSSNKEKEDWSKEVNSFPIVWFNGFQIEYSDISYFELYHEGILPTMKIMFSDRNGIFKSGGFPIDDTIISIYINSMSDILRSIRCDFIISQFKNIEANIYDIVGILNVKNILLKRFQSFSGTSWNVLKDIAIESNLGFCSNITDTNDSMTWINPGFHTFKFIEEINKKSYVDNKSFTKVYIDYYYNICFVDLEKEILRDNSDDKSVMTTFEMMREISREDDKIAPLFLSTDKSLKDTNAFILKYSVLNKSGKISINKNYLTKSNWYNTNSKEILTFDIISNSNLDKIELKSGDDDYFINNDDYKYSGKVGDNVHKNFKFSEELKYVNWNELNKVVLDIELPNPNFNLYIFQKIKIFILFDKPNLLGSLKYERLTGDWIIRDINFTFSDGGKRIQKIRLIRRDLELLEGEVLPENSTNFDNISNTDDVDSSVDSNVGDIETENATQNSTQNEQKSNVDPQNTTDISTGDFDFYVYEKVKRAISEKRNTASINNSNDIYVTIPKKPGNYEIVVFWGGIELYNGKSYRGGRGGQINKIPKRLLNNKIVVVFYFSESSTIDKAINIAQEAINKSGKQNEIKLLKENKNISILCFSAGGRFAYKQFNKNLKFFGFIDPSPWDAVNKSEYSSNTYMVYAKSNWTSFPNFPEGIEKLENIIRNSGGQSYEDPRKDHFDLITIFIEKYLNKI